MLREITRPKTNELLIKLPDSYVGQELEVLVLPSFEMLKANHIKGESVEKNQIKELFENAIKYKIDESIDLNAMTNEVNL